jgi:hypothetical protein
MGKLLLLVDKSAKTVNEADLAVNSGRISCG